MQEIAQIPDDGSVGNCCIRCRNRLAISFDFLRVRYAQFHRPMWDELTSGLSERELRGRPHPRANTIVWLVWHIARVEDLGVNRFVVDGRQRMDRGDWATRMRVTRRVSAPA